MAKEKEEKKTSDGRLSQGAKEVSTPGGLKKIKVNAEELAKLQAEKKLVGYDPATQVALIK